ncbi:hypothetical protein EV193_101576 [Herbihabitans rhizosphaerae]|uniref:Serine aminopeptidase S33 domain-containing protein n=1 Tax=Herbihabitans rhizosphaerae TaxID=1872711 RepID=A0A4Q7L749_9PSEU|nr:alpha/beta fold hydrolase [Herbihabitans rhizosphaerae]RZS44700.1 hypothetical protein EV193_101576 [Herbihabitans rhizosphaerae]
MREIELALPTEDGLAMAGTLAVPDGDGPHPAVLLLWPGKADREGNVGKARFELGRAFAEALAAQGIAAYRYDRRGVGATGGDWRATGFFAHREDAAAVLRELNARPEVSTVGAIGYSEGAMHAAWLAGHADVAAAVLLACPARTGAQLMREWMERNGSDIALPMRLILRLFGRTPDAQIRRLTAKINATKGDVARLYGVKIPARMMREYLSHDPKPDIAAMRAPVLAINGTKDIQVPVDNLDQIAEIAATVEPQRFPDLTHLLRRDPGEPSLRNYGEQYGRPVDPELVELVATWTATRLSREPLRYKES